MLVDKLVEAFIDFERDHYTERDGEKWKSDLRKYIIELVNANEAAVVELEADRKRLEWMIEAEARVYSSGTRHYPIDSEGDCIIQGPPGGINCGFDTPRAAIDAAMEEESNES